MNVLAEARKTDYSDDPVFTLQVAQGLRAFKADYETIQFVQEIVLRNAKVRPQPFAASL